MQILGFNLTKINAERSPDFKKGAINTSIDFKDVSKEEVPLIKEEVLRISFIFTVNYTKGEKDDPKKEKSQAKVELEGNLLLKATQDESKPILKDWKKKELATAVKTPLFNIILQKTAAKALDIEEQLNLPFHIHVPQIQAKPKQ